MLSLLTLLPAAISADEKQLSVYATAATYSLPVLPRSGHEYVGLLELLEPLGTVTSAASGPRWKIRFDSIEAEFTAGRTRFKLHGRDYDLTAPFLMENSRGLVPVASLGTLVPRFMGGHAELHETARRLFIGDVGIQPSFRLEASPQPHVVVNFSAAVNPTIATEPGRLRMIFKRDPIVSPGSAVITFDDRAIARATYSEADGAAELDFSGDAPLIASFANGGKTISVSVAPTVSAAPPQNQPGAGSQEHAQASSAGTGNQQAARRVIAVIDPAHGGDDRGAALSDKLAEKDVTLGFGRLLRHELELRGFSVLLLRDSDANLSLDQRAGSANGAGAAIYICLHAVSQGSGAGVYTALMPAEGMSKSAFRAWDSAQDQALASSRVLAGAIAGEIKKKQFPVVESSASLRPLNNVVIPAVAIELAPGADGIPQVTSANYQQQVAAAIADGVNSMRERLAVHP